MEEVNEVSTQSNEVTEVIESAPTVMTPPLPSGKYKLTPHQVEAAVAIIENEMTVKRKGVRKKTYIEIADELGIHRDTLRNYRSNPEFQRYITDASRLVVANSLPMAVARLYELANGDQTGTSSVKALELLLIMGGLLKKDNKHEITITQGVPDIRKVSDEDLADIIAEYSDEEETDEE